MKQTIKLDTADMLFKSVSQKDDEEAFKRLFYDYFSPLCAFAYRYLEDKESCEDVVQDVFFFLWKNRKDLEIRVSFRSFLLTTVRNACLDHLRRNEVEKKWLAQAMEKEKEEDLDDFCTVNELEHKLADALNKLPEKISSTFKMNRFEGKTYTEIASEKHLSVKTVESYMTKALKFMRLEFKDYLQMISFFLLNLLG